MEFGTVKKADVAKLNEGISNLIKALTSLQDDLDNDLKIKLEEVAEPHHAASALALMAQGVRYYYYTIEDIQRLLAMIISIDTNRKEAGKDA